MNFVSFFRDNMNLFLPIFGLLAVVIALSFVEIDSVTFNPVLDSQKRPEYVDAPKMVLEGGLHYSAVVKTSEGDFTIELFENIAPQNVNNFVFLSKEGFYDGLPFHRVIPNFIIQTGYVEDGGVRYTIQDEIKGFVRFDEYSVAMANEDEPNTNKSQFFITLKESDLSHLDGKYTIIGKIVDGFETIDKVANVQVDGNYTPEKEIILEKISIEKETY